MRSPPITVLLPFRNAGATLAECLDSVLAQSLGDFELLALNDHSDDGSEQLVAQYALRDRRVRLLHAGGRGLVTALNQGLAEARAPLIARMDADDLMHRERLAEQYRFLRAHPELDLVATQVRLFPEERLQAGFCEYVRWQNGCLASTDVADEIYVESPFAHPSVLFRRARVLALGGYRDGAFPEDYELWLRMAHAGCPMAKVPRVLLHWREGEQRLTRVDPRYSREAFDRLRARYLARDPRLQGRPLAYWGAGRKTRRRADHLIRHGFPPSAWIDIDPRKIGNRLHGVPVVAPSWLAREQRPFVLSYVTNHGAREDIAGRLAALGYRRGRDYLMVG